jgi:UDP-glucose:(heptosyl)LPS alpha-1,3-glucosyltransferase
MRLAVIRQRYTPFGGAERFLASALDALAERGVAVTLYTREWTAQRGRIDARIVDPFYVGGLWRDAAFVRAVCRAIARDPPALVQSHELLACCDIYRAGDGVHATWLEERMRHVSPLRALAIRADPRHRQRLAIERRMYASPRLSAVICNSKMVRDDIRDRFGVSPSRLHVIYNAVDAAAFSPALRAHRMTVRERHRISADATVYLLVGSGFERKGVVTAIEAMGKLPASAHLLVVGRDNDSAHYAARARALGLAGRVTFAGPQAEPHPYFGAADVFVLPTLYDPCPNAALEAMACALPVVTTTRCGAAELALEAGAGFALTPGDAAALAQHMETLQDETVRARMGERARAAVLPLTTAAMAARLIALYDSLLARQASR